MDLIQITKGDKVSIEKFTCILSVYRKHQWELREDHENINFFLKEESISHYLNHLIRTYILVNEESKEVIWFYSLFNEEIRFSNGQRRRLKYKGTVVYGLQTTEVFPAIRLHQFAINSKYQGEFINGKKYSDVLIGHMFESVRLVSEISGCMFIGLEATENSVFFYENYNFKTLRRKNGKIMPFLIFKVADLYD